MSVIVNVYATHREITAPDIEHRQLGRRGVEDPELASHLDGFAGYVAKSGGGEMTSDRYHLIQHILRVRNHLSLEVTEEVLPRLSPWARASNAVLFLPDGSVRDPEGRVLFQPGGAADPQASLPFPTDALERRARILDALAEMEVSVPASLPPTVSELEVRLRSADEVHRRTRALLVVALRAETLNTGDPWPVAEIRERFPDAFDGLSPRERAFMGQETPPPQEVVDHAWRYEALYVLSWALGHFDDLAPPTSICDVPATVKAADTTDAAELRPTSEILDALDMHYRLHWATRQAVQVERVQPPAGLEPGVIAERHHALNWLVGFQGAAWDDVDTPT
ncbi:MAG: DUF4272 domain-containing protein [Sandaracinaceae bacterium]|nr:MAG: DUF4272 domain-containing protein [Sandaracinaceae bacterium]